MSRRRRRERPIFAARGTFAVECPGCRQALGVVPDLVGRVAGCPLCDGAFLVPDPEAAEAADDSAGRWPDRGVARGDARERPAAAPRSAAAPVAPTAATSPAAADRPSTSPPVAVRPAPAAPPAAAPDEPLVFSEPPPPASRMRAGDVDASAPQAPMAPAAAPSEEAPVAPAGTPPVAATAAPASAYGDLAFREPVRTVRSGGTEIELHRLTPEEKRVRRTRRNLLILLVGAALLVALVVVLGTRGR